MIEAIPDGRGVHMIDGKMQDDATWKQCKVMVELAEMLAEKDPELARPTSSSTHRWARLAQALLQRSSCALISSGSRSPNLRQELLDLAGAAADQRRRSTVSSSRIASSEI